MNIKKNQDGSITIETVSQNAMPDGSTVPCICARDIQKSQIFAHARDSEIYNALPADVRADVDAERAALAAAAGE